MLKLKTAARKKLWTINTGWHCSIIGTCLTTEDLRTLARKLRVQTHEDSGADFRLHGHFVQACSQGGTTAKMLQKLLDRRHSAAVRRFSKADTPDALEKLWDIERQGRDVPGAFWALMSHPCLEQGLGTRAYGHIHMLSHLVGASNRADLDTLRSLEREVESLTDRLTHDATRHSRRMAEKDKEIAELQKQLVAARSGQIGFASHAAARVPANLNSEPYPVEDWKLKTISRDIEETCRRNEELEEAVATLRNEVQALETALLTAVQSRAPTEMDTCASGDCPFDLNGRCILYVGGRLANVHRLRELVAQWNGELLHHDGGMEQSLDELPACIVRADAVVFPTDCISHSAALKAKRLCRQTMKPYVPLRGSGVSSFVAGLRDKLAMMPPIPAAAE